MSNSLSVLNLVPTVPVRFAAPEILRVAWREGYLDAVASRPPPKKMWEEKKGTEESAAYMAGHCSGRLSLFRD